MERLPFESGAESSDDFDMAAREAAALEEVEQAAAEAQQQDPATDQAEQAAPPDNQATAANALQPDDNRHKEALRSGMSPEEARRLCPYLGSLSMEAVTRRMEMAARLEARRQERELAQAAPEARPAAEPRQPNTREHKASTDEKLKPAPAATSEPDEIASRRPAEHTALPATDHLRRIVDNLAEASPQRQPEPAPSPEANEDRPLREALEEFEIHATIDKLVNEATEPAKPAIAAPKPTEIIPSPNLAHHRTTDAKIRVAKVVDLVRHRQQPAQTTEGAPSVTPMSREVEATGEETTPPAFPDLGQAAEMPDAEVATEIFDIATETTRTDEAMPHVGFEAVDSTLAEVTTPLSSGELFAANVADTNVLDVAAEGPVGPHLAAELPPMSEPVQALNLHIVEQLDKLAPAQAHEVHQALATIVDKIVNLEQYFSVGDALATENGADPQQLEALEKQLITACRELLASLNLEADDQTVRAFARHLIVARNAESRLQQSDDRLLFDRLEAGTHEAKAFGFHTWRQLQHFMRHKLAPQQALGRYAVSSRLAA